MIKGVYITLAHSSISFCFCKQSECDVKKYSAKSRLLLGVTKIKICQWRKSRPYKYQYIFMQIWMGTLKRVNKD